MDDVKFGELMSQLKVIADALNDIKKDTKLHQETSESQLNLIDSSLGLIDSQLGLIDISIGAVESAVASQKL